MLVNLNCNILKKRSIVAHVNESISLSGNFIFLYIYKLGVNLINGRLDIYLVDLTDPFQRIMCFVVEEVKEKCKQEQKSVNCGIF